MRAARVRGAALSLLLALLCGCAELLQAGLGLPSPQVRVAWRMPQIQQSALPNGMGVYVVEQPYLPLVSVHLALRAGSAAVPPAQAGLPQIAYDLMLFGSAVREVERELAALGATPQVSVGVDGAEVHLVARKGDLPEVLELLGEALARPRLSEADFGLLQRNARLRLATSARSPASLGGAVLLRSLYGAEHPYGALRHGTPESVAALRREDVVRFHERFTGPSNAALVIAGRVTLAEVEALALRIFGGWQARSVGVEVPPPPPPARRDRIFGVAMPGSPQTLILMGKRTVPMGHPDELPLQFVYGVPGAWASGELRWLRGVTYGVGSGLSSDRVAGHMVTITSVQSSATRASLRQLLKEQSDAHDLFRMSHDSIYEARARRALAVMGNFEGISGSAHAAARLFFLGLPADHYLRRVEAILSVQSGEISPTARTYLGSDATLQIVLVGDPEVIERQVVPMNLGQLEWVGSPL